jgi:CRISPR-associated protein Csd1
MVWHTGCAWQQRLGKDRVFVGAPAPRDIAETAYGEHVDKNLRKTTIERILPCIVDNAIVPRDLVDGCVRQACNRMGLEHWEWEKALGVACALYKYQYKERSYTMPLDTESISRDYLYGRLLALAEHLEGRALNIAGETRETGAARLMQRFADRPYSTWRTIETSLTPYKTRLRAKRPGFLINISREIDTVVSSFKHDDYISDLRLTGEFLLGYHCQRDALWSHPSDESNTNELTIKTEE